MHPTSSPLLAPGHLRSATLRPLCRAAALASLCALLALPHAAAAQATPSKAEAASDGEAAKAFFVQGQSEYDLGHFQEALSLFEQAYKKRNVAALLYNIAQCHRQLGDLKMARTTYKAFLAKQPGSQFAPLAKEKLAEVEQALEAQQNVRSAQPTDLAPASGDAKDASASPSSPASPASSKGDDEKAPAKSADLTPPATKPAGPAKEVAAVKDASAAKDAIPAKEPAKEPALTAEAAKPREQAPVPSIVKIKPRPTPAEPEEPGRTWTWVAGGAAVVALAAGIAFGTQSQSTADSLATTDHSGAQVKQLSADVASQASKGNLLLGVGLGLAAVSAACFVLHF